MDFLDLVPATYLQYRRNELIEECQRRKISALTEIPGAEPALEECRRTLRLHDLYLVLRTRFAAKPKKKGKK